MSQIPVLGQHRSRLAAALVGLAMLLTGCDVSPAAQPPSTSAGTPSPTAPRTMSAAPTTRRTSLPSTRTRPTTAHRAEDWSGTRGLRPDLARALMQARQAAPHGVRLRVTSGYRPAEQQDALWRAAIRKYGSKEAAREWVLPARDSSHVRGEAVDLGPRSGARWLQRRGAQFGLCRSYRNEWWHFEHTGQNGGCPPMLRSAADVPASQ